MWSLAFDTMSTFQALNLLILSVMTSIWYMCIIICFEAVRGSSTSSLFNNIQIYASWQVSDTPNVIS
jgi:hypothetical protein